MNHGLLGLFLVDVDVAYVLPERIGKFLADNRVRKRLPSGDLVYFVLMAIFGEGCRGDSRNVTHVYKADLSFPLRHVERRITFDTSRVHSVALHERIWS